MKKMLLVLSYGRASEKGVVSGVLWKSSPQALPSNTANITTGTSSSLSFPPSLEEKEEEVRVVMLAVCVCVCVCVCVGVCVCVWV